MSKPEFRVRPVVRYVVTRFEPAEMGQNKVETLGEFDNERFAEEAAYALQEQYDQRQALVEHIYMERAAQSAQDFARSDSEVERQRND